MTEETGDYTQIAEKIRREPYHALTNNCVHKSLRFRDECRRIGIRAKIVLALVITPCKRFLLPPYIVWFHAWAEVDGQRIELARLLDERSPFNTYDIDVKPVVAVYLM